MTSVLRISSRAEKRRFVTVHHILGSAAWCPHSESSFLLGMLVSAFAPLGPVFLAASGVCSANTSGGRSSIGMRTTRHAG